MTDPRPGAMLAVLTLCLACCVSSALAQDASTDPLPAPPRAEGEGPFDRLVIRNATLNDETGKSERVGGTRYTIKDGIVYDARQLLADVERMVARQKTERGLTRLPEIEFSE